MDAELLRDDLPKSELSKKPMSYWDMMSDETKFLFTSYRPSLYDFINNENNKRINIQSTCPFRCSLIW